MNENAPHTDIALTEADSPAESASAEMERLQADLAAAKDRMLRAQAEAENVRKRMRREMDEFERFAAMPVIKEMLGVLDDLDRAVDAATSASNPSLVEGIALVRTRMLEALARHGCRRIEALGAPFDPALHEAILMQPSADQPPNTVLQVAQQGYTLHDRVVRPAKVIVVKSPGE